MSAEPQSPSGIVIVDKPLSLTSMTVCRSIKRRLIAGGAPRKVKVGHAGTLDPLATGVIIVLVGRATRLCERIMAGEKRYTAEVDLSRRSDTDDREGEITVVEVPHPPSREQVARACGAFVGAIRQRPPAHSAIWIGGERAYHLARRADAPPPEMAERIVTIHAIDVIDYRWPIAVLDIRCGKGTYIRSLARDLGAALGCGGMLNALRRTEVAPYTIDRATPLDDLPGRMTQDDLLPPPA